MRLILSPFVWRSCLCATCLTAEQPWPPQAWPGHPPFQLKVSLSHHRRDGAIRNHFFFALLNIPQALVFSCKHSTLGGSEVSEALLSSCTGQDKTGQDRTGQEFSRSSQTLVHNFRFKNCLLCPRIVEGDSVHQVVMKLDSLKFLNTAPQQIQKLVFGGDDNEQENSQKEIALPDAETSLAEVQKGLDELSTQAGCQVPPFVPYTQIIPWHSGTRNMFSKFFPRYGNYCGPNYSSGRESGSHYWDKPPTDWLDYCCYRHDMGYDTLDQPKLLDADRQFLNCLRNIPESATVSSVGRTYQNLYMIGLERFLVPYRDILVKKIEEGKQGKETEPEVIVEEVKERNADMDRSS